MLLAGGHKRLKRSLDDALRADVNPRAGGHLAVHHQAELLQFVELLPVGPVAHQVGVTQQHARRVLVRLEDAYGLARLHQQSLVILQRLQRVDDGVVAVPVARGPARTAINHEVLRTLGDVGIEVVHQHAHGGFLRPTFAGELVAARRTHRGVGGTRGIRGDRHNT